jgi:hypothetical protein
VLHLQNEGKIATVDALADSASVVALCADRSSHAHSQGGPNHSPSQLPHHQRPTPCLSPSTAPPLPTHSTTTDESTTPPLPVPCRSALRFQPRLPPSSSSVAAPDPPRGGRRRARLIGEGTRGGAPVALRVRRCSEAGEQEDRRTAADPGQRAPPSTVTRRRRQNRGPWTALPLRTPLRAVLCHHLPHLVAIQSGGHGGGELRPPFGVGATVEMETTATSPAGVFPGSLLGFSSRSGASLRRRRSLSLSSASSARPLHHRQSKFDFS